MSDFASIPVLITGAEGFIGSHLARRLAGEGARVSALVRPGADLSRLDDLSGRIEIYPRDIRRREELTDLAVAVSPRLVFHLAAVTDPSRSPAGLDRCLEVNLGGTLNLLQALAKSAAARLVTVDTAEIYGRNPAPFREEMPPDPVSPYSLSKAAATLLCRTWAAAYNFPVTVLRLFLVYGPGQGEERFLPQAIAAGIAGRPLRMTAGEQTREYIYVSDAVEGLLRASRRGPSGEVINLGSGEEISLGELVGRVSRILGREIALAEEVLPYRENEIMRFVGEHKKAETLLGWRPAVSLEEGLRRTVEWAGRDSSPRRRPPGR